MTYVLLKRPIVNQDISSAMDYLASDNVDVALRFYESCQRTFEHLCRTPTLGGPGEFANPRLKGINRWKVNGFENYQIYYMIHPQAVEILRVIHAARDLDQQL